MAKKGTFYRWRIVFNFPGGASGTDHQLESFDHAVREAANLLFRGADVDIVEIDEATRERRVLHDLRACDFDFPTEDDDLGGYDYPIDVARDMVHERVYGKPTDRAVRMEQQALAEAVPSGEEASRAAQAFAETLSASKTTDPEGELKKLTERVAPVHKAVLKARADLYGTERVDVGEPEPECDTRAARVEGEVVPSRKAVQAFIQRAAVQNRAALDRLDEPATPGPRRSAIPIEQRLQLLDHLLDTGIKLRTELYAQYRKAVREDHNVQDVFKRLLFIEAYGSLPEESALFYGFEAALHERVIKDLREAR